ncbi:MAG: DUF3579 domain-containing protein [Gammaproteobacteria bacterium]|nr:DUF3579 domain-containing protein [Gammaproteobacteria bacterium]
MAIKEILIKPITLDGKRFRPSDWADRLYYALATYDHQGKPVFNPLVCLKHENDLKCFAINPKLEEEEPMTYEFLMDFANSNELTITDQDHSPIDL